ncbi:MAG: single-stranded-DNA-specific exonuclease RecJ [Clostridiales bacterium]|nr:single-stranded-DNA-specific exonuclease RecJ [Clostridiales bacterium]
MRQKKWIISGFDRDAAEALKNATGLSKLAVSVLCSRGIDTVSKAREFLQAAPSILHDPFLLKDMDIAVAKIKQSIKAGEKIAVYGDYDVDGVTATCVLVKYLRSKGSNCEFYIPDRLSEGYGLNIDAIGKLYSDGVKLLITVDSGITAIDEAEFASEIGLSLIITDHHECRDIIPNALAVINPRRQDSIYPFRELAGVGVAFKLICALEGKDKTEELLSMYGEYVAIGTIADVMPLINENRAIVKSGLSYIESTKNPGLKMLMKQVGMDGKRITSNAVSFILAPRINAAGRLGRADRAARLFLTQDYDEAERLAEELCELNRNRQTAENEILEEIIERLKTEFNPAQDHVIVLWGENWHHGVIGIVSSRISDRYGLPTVLISLEGDLGKGSGRSVSGFNLFEGLQQCSHLLEKFGGHELAVGLSIDRRNLLEFKKRLNEYASRITECKRTISVLPIDCEAEIKNIDIHNVKGLYELEPYGMGNQQPIFYLGNVTVEEITPISSERHLKMSFSKEGYWFYAFMFGTGSANCRFVEGDFVDIAFSLEINNYKNKENVQLILKDIRRTADEEDKDGKQIELYRQFMAGEQIRAADVDFMMPSRDNLVAVFRHVKTNASNGVLVTNADTLYRKIRRESKTKLELSQLMLCLEVFREFEIFNYINENGSLRIGINQFEDKVDIFGSKILLKLKQAREA